MHQNTKADERDIGDSLSPIRRILPSLGIPLMRLWVGCAKLFDKCPVRSWKSKKPSEEAAKGTSLREKGAFEGIKAVIGFALHLISLFWRDVLEVLCDEKKLSSRENENELRVQFVLYHEHHNEWEKILEKTSKTLSGLVALGLATYA
ncbi:hypothetical protein CEXT_120831 [Caerostris extrusa]|uniref:Uncharacterized protein n=1 Tax=Caerostris extrusa TaxID=172846 RepID=A0AAV4TL46_CAEEX|nr:hypothetical protein CEXT_120831 [Caerostris extrusa]